MRDISRRTALEALTYVAGFLVVGRARLSAQPAPLVRRDVTQLSNEEQARFKEAVKALKSKMIGGESAWLINADTSGLSTGPAEPSRFPVKEARRRSGPRRGARCTSRAAPD